MSTLVVVEEILRETQVPMSVRQIVELAGDRLPTKSKTPDTVVARDLSMDIKKKGEASLFVRTAPGRYTMRELHMRALAEQEAQAAPIASTAAEAAATENAAAEAAVAIAGTQDAAPMPAQATAAQASVTQASTGDGQQEPARIVERADEQQVDTTSVLSSAIRAERAATLPAKKPALTDEQTGTARQ